MKNSNLLFCLTLLLAQSAFAFGKAHPKPLDTVKNVDIYQYGGLWYEIARLPQKFEKDCTGVTANYSLKNEDRIEVVNTCRKYSLEGKLKIARGWAHPKNANDFSKLRVTFFWPFFGDYWILELGNHYEYSVVGSPDRKSLWILSRTPKMDEKQVSEILERRILQGFDTSKIEFTIQ